MQLLAKEIYRKQSHKMETVLPPLLATENYCVPSISAPRFLTSQTGYIYIYEIAENSWQQPFQGNTTKSAVVTLWELLTKCQMIIFIMNNSDKLPWLPELISSAPNSGCREAYNNLPHLRRTQNWLHSSQIQTAKSKCSRQYYHW